jgi:hypothetical protein
MIFFVCVRVARFVMYVSLWLLAGTCFEPRYIMRHQIYILAWAFGYARVFFFFFFKCVLSMSGGEEGVHGSLLLTDLSLLRSRPWRSEFLDLAWCLSDILQILGQNVGERLKAGVPALFLKTPGCGDGRCRSLGSFDSLV